MTGESVWRLLAACKNADPGLFVGPDNETALAREQREKHAKKICARCPVISDCLGFAIDHRIVRDVWGGLGGEARSYVLDCAATRAASTSTAPR